MFVFLLANRRRAIILSLLLSNFVHKKLFVTVFSSTRCPDSNERLKGFDLAILGSS